MILFLDVRNAATTVGAIDTKKERWLSVEGDRSGMLAVAKARAKFGIDRKPPQAVVVAMNAPGANARDVSWSSVRAGIAVANALAFAWGVPVAAIAVNGDEAPEAVVALARDAAAHAEPGVWVSAHYSGEPNITTPKKK